MIRIKNISKSKLTFIFLLVIIIPTFSSLLRPGYFPMHDDMQAMRILQMDKCVKDGQIPCRWVPDMGYGYGYPQFNYYAPLPYYAMETFHLLGLSILGSVKAGFVASVLLSAFGMFLLGRALWGNAGGFLSALLYAYAPYRAVDIYVRGAVGEFWAMGFLPVILWSAAEVFKNNKRAKLWLALSLAGLFTSHNITTLIFTPVIIIWVVFLVLIRKQSSALNIKRRLKDLILGAFWGFLLSAFYVLPMWIERNFVHIETLLQGYFNYLAHFVSIGQLLFSSYWGYGSSELGPYDDISFAVGLMQWTLPLLALLLVILLRKKKEALLVLFFIIVGWVSLFMTHLKSVFIWDRIPILAYLQFPWRFLTIATFSFSVAAGGITLLFSKKKTFVFLSLVGLISLILLLYSSYFKPRIWIDITDSEKFSGEQWDKQQTISIFDYLPIYAELPPKERAPVEPQIVEGNADVISGQSGTNWQKWMINVSSESGVVRLPLYDFPGWKVWVDGDVVSINHDNNLGLITFSLSRGDHEIEARLTDTPIRSVGNIASVVGLIAIPIVLSKGRKKK